MADIVAALPDGYPDFLSGFKTRLRDAQLRALRVVNTQLVKLYWQIGNEILIHQGIGREFGASTTLGSLFWVGWRQTGRTVWCQKTTAAPSRVNANRK